jgi:hypothetical protein
VPGLGFFLSLDIRLLMVGELVIAMGFRCLGIGVDGAEGVSGKFPGEGVEYSDGEL